MRPVLLATDGSASADAATVEAIELARRFGAPLVAVTAWELPYGGLGYVPLPLSAHYFDECEEAAERIVDDVVERAREAGVTATGFAVRGYPTTEIARTAARVHPLAIVLGSHAWGAAGRALHGSVSTRVLHHARCPVLVVPASRGDSTVTATAPARAQGAAP